MEFINYLLGITVPTVTSLLIFLLVPIGAGFINGIKPRQAKIGGRILTGIILIVLFIPLNTVDEPGKSMLNFILNGKIFFGLMFLGYLVTFILLFIDSFKKSWALPIIFFLAYLSFWKDVLSLPNSSCNCTHWGFMLWINAFVIAPLITLAFVWRSIEKR